MSPPFLARPWAGDTLRDHIGWGGQGLWKGAGNDDRCERERMHALTPSKLPATRLVTPPKRGEECKGSGRLGAISRRASVSTQA